MTYHHIGKGTRAIITGASWGIGETFAEQLAARGADLLLVARSKGRLQTIAARLCEQYSVRVQLVTVDLADPDGPRQLCEQAAALGFEANLLVNNAGIGVLGPFAELPLERARDMLRLNIVALTDLTYRLLSEMAPRGEGAIINVGSASAFQPLPNYGVYAATKAFVISLTAALWAEMRQHGIRVVAVCPGAVDPGRPDGVEPARQPHQLWKKVTREQVVVSALDALAADIPFVLPGAPPAVARLALGLLPRRARLRFTGMLLRRFPAMLTGTRRRDP